MIFYERHATLSPAVAKIDRFLKESPSGAMSILTKMKNNWDIKFTWPSFLNFQNSRYGLKIRKEQENLNKCSEISVDVQRAPHFQGVCNVIWSSSFCWENLMLVIRYFFRNELHRTLECLYKIAIHYFFNYNVWTVRFLKLTKISVILKRLTKCRSYFSISEYAGPH